jgi:hypothetical protein
MKWIRKCCRSINFWLNVFGILALAYIINYGIWLSKISAICYGADTIGEIMNAVAYSFIAGYIIYMIPYTQKKRASKPVVDSAIALIFDCKKHMLKQLEIQKGFKFQNSYPTDSEWIDYEKQPIKIENNDTWKDLIEDYSLQLSHYFRYIYLFHDYNWNLIRPIIDIEYSLISGQLLSNYTKPKETKNITVNIDIVKDFFESIQKLESVYYKRGGKLTKEIRYLGHEATTKNSKISKTIKYKYISKINQK